jgi:transcriptional regulator with XRE-family HTH domain
MTEIEILRTLIDTLAGGSQSDFAKRTGINKTALNKILNGHGEEENLHLGAKYKRLILSAFPQVNPAFLNGTDDYPGELTAQDRNKSLEAMIVEKDRTIEELRKELALQRRVIEKLLGGEK